MSVSETRQLIILLYEYLYNEGNRTEAAYYNSFDKTYRDLFSSHPERRISNERFLECIERKAQFDKFCQVQKDIYDILSLYKDTAFSDSINR